MVGDSVKLINIWLLAKDFISKKYLIYVVSVAMCVLTMLLFSASLFAYSVTKYGRKQCDELFAMGTEQTGVFRFNTDNEYENYFDIWADFMNEIEQTEEIYAVGNYDIWGGSIPGAKELIQIQNEIAPEIHNSGIPEDVLVLISINKEGAGLFRLKYQSGCFMESDGKTNYVYLGADYASIEVGTVFRDENGTCVVAGIFEKGTRIINPQILFRETDTLELDYSICIDNMVVFCDGGVGSNWITFSVNDGYTVEEGIETIEKIGKKYGIEITGASCEELLYRRDVNNEKIISATRNMLIWLILVIFIIMLCIQISDFIERSDEFGIMYANGSSTRDVSMIVMMENIRRVVIAFILWLGIAIVICKTAIIPHYENDIYKVDGAIIMDIFLKNIVPWVAVFALAYICIMSIVPIIMVRKTQPIKLIGRFKI